MTDRYGPEFGTGRGEHSAPSVAGRVTGGAGRPWVGVAANAGSGRGSGLRRVDRLVKSLKQQGLESRVAWSVAERSALVADSARDARCRCLVAAGGDGTVAALVNEQPAVPITVLPTGTENLFARHFGLSRDPVRLASTIATGRTFRIDLGGTRSRRFALMAGIGFDADVVTRHHHLRLGRSGIARPTNRGAYVESVLRSSFEYRFPPLTVAIVDPGAEEILVGATAFVFNMPRYALGLPFAPSAREDDGWLDLVVFRDPGPFRALHYLWTVVRGIHLVRSDVYHRKVRRLVVSAGANVPVQLDGDPGGYVTADTGPNGDWTIEILPRAIDVLVPCA